MTEEQELVMNRKPAKNLTDQHILNSLRFETKATDIRAHRIGMRRVLSLYRRGQIARRLSGEMRGTRYQKFYVYRTIVTDDFPMPFQCTGSFCHGKNLHGDRRYKLCRPCRDAKLRYNKTERSSPANVWRANRARQVFRYHQSMKKFEARGGVRPPTLRGLWLFNRLTGMKISDGSPRAN
jgi:hypothetical protein